VSKSAPKRRILIVGEGRETEYNYFVGFREAFEAELDAMATSISVRRGKGGDAKSIVEHAIKESNNFQPDPKLGDRVFLLFDTEGAGRAPELPAAEKLAQKHEIEIIYSSPAIEFWFLCHFPKAKRGAYSDCDAAIIELNKKWKNVCKTDYSKSDQDIFSRLASQFPIAVSQSLEIDLHHLKTVDVAVKTNPSSQIYELIAILIGKKSGEKCPLAGTWKHIANNSIAIILRKGETISDHEGAPVHWQL